jgi:UDP-N-acetylmuramate dehydrogenase
VVSAELDALAEALGPLAVRDHPLGALTTYRVGGTGALYVEVDDDVALAGVRAACAGRAVAVLVLGRGSNMVVADAGFEGLVVHLGAGFETFEAEARPDRVRAGGALGLPVLARRSVEAARSGLEWAVGVPGSVGGAVRMNAGGHGSDMAASLVRCGWVDLADGGVGESSVADLAYGYRTSALGPSTVVTWAEFAVSPGDVEAGRAQLTDIVRWRREHQPGGSNAGSVFKNPEGDSAGRLIDAAGLKGFRIGSAEVSTKHANFIQADDGGSADDVAALIGEVATRVRERFGVTLETEVRLIGFGSGETGGPRALRTST